METSTMKILVTGSSGTIGTRLCQQLLESGHKVIGVDWKPNKWDRRVNEITIQTDLRDKEAIVANLPTDVDMIIHLAANARVYNLIVDPSLARDNFETTINVLEYARVNGVRKFIFASSREVYGNSGKPINVESDAGLTNCESPYTASKIAGEALVNSYRQCYGIDFIIFRFSNVYGMYDESDRVIPLFIKRCLNNEDISVFGQEKFLDFTYIDDVIDGVMRGVALFEQKKNDVYNIACGEGISIVNVAHMIKAELQSNNQINIEENRVGEVVKYVADITKARNQLGFSPRVPPHEGIKKSIQWYTTHLYSIDGMLPKKAIGIS